MEQLSLLDVLDEQPEADIPVEQLFAPNGRQRCPHCRQRLTPFAAKLYCLHVGCTSGGAS